MLQIAPYQGGKMGRIKTQLIKRTTFEVLARSNDKFTTNYVENKKVVNQLIDVKSKKIRNTIAGYATRLVKKQRGKNAKEHTSNS